MKLGERAARLAAVAGVAALIAGSITGTLLTIEDEAWPGRGGMKAVLQISALFTAYAFAVALAAGALLSVTLSPLMARRGPLAHLLAGLPLGLGIHLLIDAAIGERIDSAEDWLGGTVAGAAAGPLWWLLHRRHFQKGSPRMKLDFGLSRTTPRIISPADAAFRPDDPSNSWSDNA